VTGALEQDRCGLYVADVAGSQHQGIGSAQHVGQGMDFGCPAATGAADRLIRAPPFPPNAERCALMEVLSTAVLFVAAPACAGASSNFVQKPRLNQRLKRL
jgi:hypothetical protein